MTKKQECRKCHVMKSLEDFPPEPRNDSGRQYKCRVCRNTEIRDRWENDKEFRDYHNAYRKEWHHTRGYVHKYGITRDDYHAMLKAQGGKCALCGTNDHGRSNYRFKWWSTDHCHETGRVRGLLCQTCNTSLGHYELMLKKVGREKIEAYINDTTQLPTNPEACS